MREDLTPIAALFGIEMTRTREDLFIPGSPERCIWRAVIEDDRERTWVIERITGRQKVRRERIGTVLNRLIEKGLEFVPAYRPVGGFRRGKSSGAYVAEASGVLWQASPYIINLPLPQPAYVDDEWRGRAVGELLARFDAASRDKAVLAALRPHPEHEDALQPLPEYIGELMDVVAERNPQVHRRLTPVCRFLDPWTEAWGGLDRTPAHGDMHPLNILWGREEIVGLIDWEFVAMRPALYDAANCVGCVGIEDPQALGRGLVPALMRTLRERELLTADTGRMFFELMVGIRFAWMSEWLRKKDREMVELELDYLDLLLEHAGDIKKMWNL